MAQITGLGDQPRTLALICDMMLLDADALSCSLLWRASFAIPQPAPALRLLVGVNERAHPFSFAAVPTARNEDGEDPQTVLLGEALATDSTVETFDPGASQNTTVRLDEKHGDTVKLDRPVPSQPALPFRDGQSAVVPESASGPGEPPPSTGTVDLSEAIGRKPTLPFDEAAGVAVALAPKGDVPKFRVGMPRPPAPIGVPEPAPKSQPAAAAQIVPLAEPPVVCSTVGLVLFNDTALSADVVPWAMEPSRACLSVVAKATCDIVPGESVQVQDSAEPLSGERFADDELGRYCVYPGDRVPFKLRTDVLLVGQAYAAEPDTTKMEASLRFGPDERGVRRDLLVYGPRRWQRVKAGYAPSEPEPFTQVPLCFPLAFGGEGFALNPVGMGWRSKHPGSSRRGALPQLEDPHQRLRMPKQTPPPACFAPIPLAWKRRWIELGRADSPWTGFTEAYDWALYQATGLPQQCPWPQGDESFELCGVHPELPVLDGRLPELRVRAFVAWRTPDDPFAPPEPTEPSSTATPIPGFTKWGQFDEIAMAIDTLLFEPDQLKLTMLYRGLVPVVDETQHHIAAIHLISEPLQEPPRSLDSVRARAKRREPG